MLQNLSSASVVIGALRVNRPYSDGFSHADSCNRDGIVHYIFQGVTGRHFKINMFFSP